MGDVTKDLRNLVIGVGAIIALSMVDILGIIILFKFKETGEDISPGEPLINSTIDAFVLALIIVSSFIGLIILALMAKVVIRVMRA